MHHFLRAPDPHLSAVQVNTRCRNIKRVPRGVPSPTREAHAADRLMGQKRVSRRIPVIRMQGAEELSILFPVHIYHHFPAFPVPCLSSPRSPHSCLTPPVDAKPIRGFHPITRVPRCRISDYSQSPLSSRCLHSGRPVNELPELKLGDPTPQLLGVEDLRATCQPAPPAPNFLPTWLVSALSEVAPSLPQALTRRGFRPKAGRPRAPPLTRKEVPFGLGDGRF